jgi:site-specific DNA-cytosine methylase
MPLLAVSAVRMPDVDVGQRGLHARQLRLRSADARHVRRVRGSAVTPFAIDVCAGAGGLSLGLRRAGFETHGVEHDPDAVETHRANVGPCDLADITTWHPPRSADLVAGGVPCQPFSVAGDRLGLDDDRGQLFRHLIRIAIEANARAVLLENVRGLLSWGGGRAIAEIECAFRDAGYEPTRRILNAADYGVPQFRQRLFVVGFRDAAARAAFRWPTPTHCAPRGLFTLAGLRPWVTVREALGLAGDFAAGREDGASGWQGQRCLDVDAPGYAIGTARNADKIGPLDRPGPVIKANSTHEGASRRASQRPATALSVALAEAALLDRPAPTISAGGTDSGGGPEPIANADSRRALLGALAEAGLDGRPSTSIVAGSSGRVAAAGHHDSYWNGAVRLTIDQCAALQSFPPGFRFVGETATSVHKQVGNAVPPRLGEALGGGILAALRASDAAEPEAAE